MSNFTFKCEVTDDKVILIFDQKMDDLVVPYQEAWALGQILEDMAGKIPNKPLIVNPVQAEFEANKMRLKRYRKVFVALIFDHTDRLELSYEAARICGRAIREMAQDIQYEMEKGIHILYNHPGRQGRPTPAWDADRMKKTFKTH